MSSEFADSKGENIFDKFNKLKKELYRVESFEVELNSLFNIIELYNNKKSDDDCEEAKLKIGIMGQVNSGKSSFLNALIFSGENVLPKDCISKTKIITKINYSKKKRIEVEFYTKKEWGEIKNVLIKEGEMRGVDFVKEVFEFINASENDVDKYINKHNEIIDFQNYDELLEKIQECDNKYNSYRFPIKAMNIYIDDERLKSIEILDTPGVNDSNLVRKYTIDRCFKYVDIIFFLSQAAIFLDDLDVNLISNQIPMESASNVFLVASKYDNVIIDEGWKFKSLIETDEYIKLRLTNRAKKYVVEHISNNAPIFISAMANNLAFKEKENYTDEEQYIIKQLNDLWHEYIFDKEKLRFIGNFEEVKNKINNKLDVKESLLVKLKEEVEKILFDIKEKSKQNVHVMESTDIKYISIEQEKIKLKSQKIYKSIEAVIEKNKALAAQNKKQVEIKLESDFISLYEINTKKKTIKIENENSKNNTKWYDGILKKINNEQLEDDFFDYECIEMDQVVENIIRFTNNANMYLHTIIKEFLELGELQENIIKIMCENMDENNVDFKPNFIKEVIEKSILNIKLSNLNIENEEYIAIIKSKFRDETIGQAIEVLKVNFKAIMKKIYNDVLHKLGNEFQIFIFQLDKVQIEAMKYVLEITNDRIEKLKEDSKDLDKKIKSYRRIIRILSE